MQWSDTLIIIKNFSVDLTVHLRHFLSCGNSSAFKIMNIVWSIMKSTYAYIDTYTHAYIYMLSLCYAFIHPHTYMILGLLKKKSSGRESTFFKYGSNCLLCMFYRSLLTVYKPCLEWLYSNREGNVSSLFIKWQLLTDHITFNTNY